MKKMVIRISTTLPSYIRRCIRKTARIAGWLCFIIAAMFTFSLPSYAASPSTVSHLIGALVFVLLPALILFCIGVVLFNLLKKRRARKSFLSEENLEELLMSQESLSETPQEEDEESEDDELDMQTLEGMALKELGRAQKFRNAGRIAEYYAAISLTIRQYLGERYGIKAIDASTSQILEHLPDGLTDTIFDQVGEILRTCDMMSLRRHRPSRSELDRIYNVALNFIQSQAELFGEEDDDEEEIFDEDLDDIREMLRRFLSEDE